MSTIRARIDDRALRARLQAIADEGKTLRPAMDSIGFALEQRIALCFEDQASPWGTPWAPLKPATLKRRRDEGRDGVSILRDLGLLLGSLSYQATAQGVDVRIGAEDRPAAVHQFGSSRGVPARPFLPIRPDGRLDLPPDWYAEVMDTLAAHLEGSA